MRNDPEYEAVWAADLAAIEAAYGAPLISQTWPGADRGATLIHFSAIIPCCCVVRACFILRGSRTCAIGSEQTAKWPTTHLLMPGDNADENQDITAIAHADQSFDVVLCHRVMAHVLDDRKGFLKLYRILRPGGFTSFSVPQAPHSPQTTEWVIPDLTHHSHLRHHSVDLEERMQAAGSVVELEP